VSISGSGGHVRVSPFLSVERERERSGVRYPLCSDDLRASWWSVGCVKSVDGFGELSKFTN